MSFTNATNINPKRSITELIRFAIDRGFSESEAVLDVSRRISMKRTSKRRLAELYRELSNTERSYGATKG